MHMMMEMSLRLEQHCTVWVVAKADVPYKEVYELVTTGAAVIMEKMGKLPYPFVLCKRKRLAKKLAQHFEDHYIDVKYHKVTWVL